MRSSDFCSVSYVSLLSCPAVFRPSLPPHNSGSICKNIRKRKLLRFLIPLRSFLLYLVDKPVLYFRTVFIYLPYFLLSRTLFYNRILFYCRILTLFRISAIADSTIIFSCSTNVNSKLRNHSARYIFSPFSISDTASSRLPCPRR